MKFRTKSLRMTNKTKQPGSSELKTMLLNIDGENLSFKNFVKYDCLKHKI